MIPISETIEAWAFTFIIVVLIGTYWLLIQRLNVLIRHFKGLNDSLSYLESIKKYSVEILRYVKQFKNSKIKLSGNTPVGKIDVELDLQKVGK